MRTRLYSLIIALSLAYCASGQGFTVTKNGPDLNVSRYGHATVNLPNGKVLVIGGHTTGFNLTATAEIYDPIADTWTLFNITNPHDMLSMAELNNGTWLFMGGCSYASGVGQSNVTTIYDPVSNTFTAGPYMYRARTNSSAAKLANGDVLIFGNWYSTGDAETYNAAGNYFSPAGSVITERSHAIVLPCADTTAVIFGGYTPYGGAIGGAVEMYDHASGQFSAFSTEIFPGETGWKAAWNAMYQPIEKMRLSTGEYVFLTYKTVGSVNTYRIGKFNPATKEFSLLNTTPSLPDYDATSANPYAIWGNIFVDPNQDYIYLNAYDAVSGNREEIIYTIDATNEILSIPTGNMTFSHYLASGSKAWVNGSIMYTGGTNDGSNFNVSNVVTFLQPNNSFEVAVEPNIDYAISVYPNPVTGTALNVNFNGLAFDELILVDITGRTVWQTSSCSNQQHVKINLQTLSPGVYLLVAVSKNERLVTRLVFQ